MSVSLFRIPNAIVRLTIHLIHRTCKYFGIFDFGPSTPVKKGIPGPKLNMKLYSTINLIHFPKISHNYIHVQSIVITIVIIWAYQLQPGQFLFPSVQQKCETKSPYRNQKLFEEMKEYAKKLYPWSFNNGFSAIVAETLAQPLPEYDDYFSTWENIKSTHTALNRIGFYQVRIYSSEALKNWKTAQIHCLPQIEH